MTVRTITPIRINSRMVSRTWQRPRKPRGTQFRPERKRSGTSAVGYADAARFVLSLSPAPAIVMTALFYSGLRPIELFALEAADVDVEKRWLTVRSSKTGEPRGVPIHEFLVPLLKALVHRGDPLFRTPNNVAYPIFEGSGGQIKSAILGARRRTGLTTISPYTARHSVSTQLVVAGVHPHVKDQILGHAATDMSRRHTQVPQQPLIEAINRLPVIDQWAVMPWMSEPAKYTRRRSPILASSYVEPEWDNAADAA
ncbi:tyrosine-type recombinase/integrase [Rhodopseudomonas palustris]|nr:tyrosine-type recombinase/integrase [Rhodopseudomonas palustris]